MELNEKAVKWFCKCYKVPISITQVNLFLGRIEVLKRVNKTLDSSLSLFIDDLKNFYSLFPLQAEELQRNHQKCVV